MIEYTTGCGGLSAEMLGGFFDGWPAQPDAAGLVRILSNSALAVLAWESDRVVGLANALSDGEFAVYLPLVEVRATHRGRGIGAELVRVVMRHFAQAYMIDAVCDDEAVAFYERLGMTHLNGMAYRNREAPILRPSIDSGGASSRLM